jgi:hypothetical protein
MIKAILSLVVVFVLLSGPGAGLAQTVLTNDDIPKLVKSGLSEDFILNLIDRQGSKLSSDAPRLVDLKNSGVSEGLIAAVVKHNPPSEPMTSDAVVQLVKVGFSESFIIDLLKRQPGRLSFIVDANRIVELKQAGLSERILAAMIALGGSRELPSGTEITVRLIDAIDSEKSNEGDEFRASPDEPLQFGDDMIAPKGADAKVRLVTQKESGKLTGKTELTVQLLSFMVNGKAVQVHTTRVTEASGSRGARTAKTAAAVGAAGAIIGAITGGGKGAAIGAGAGAAAGAGAQVFMKGQRVRIPSETVITFTTQDTVKLP